MGNNPSSNILLSHFQFLYYCQKYLRSRRQYLEELLTLMLLVANLASTN